MKRVVINWLVAVLVVSMSTSLSAVDARVDGAAAGAWTMDLDAAKTLAREQKLPLLLNFSGSDWCGWCKLMEKNVFSMQAWKAFATNSVVMVLVDFPNDKTLVPEKFVERNNTLKELYDVKGFPTFIVLDDDGATVLGRLSAGRDKTPESFAGELKALFRYRPAEIETYAKALSAEDREAYVKIADGMASCKKGIRQQKEAIAAAEKQVADLEERLAQLGDDATEFRAAQLGDDQLEQYRTLKGKLAEAEKALADWLGTKPDRSEENQKKFQSLSSEVKELKEQLGSY